MVGILHSRHFPTPSPNRVALPPVASPARSAPAKPSNRSRHVGRYSSAAPVCVSSCDRLRGCLSGLLCRRGGANLLYYFTSWISHDHQICRPTPDGVSPEPPPRLLPLTSTKLPSPATFSIFRPRQECPPSLARRTRRPSSGLSQNSPIKSKPSPSPDSTSPTQTGRDGTTQDGKVPSSSPMTWWGIRIGSRWWTYR